MKGRICRVFCRAKKMNSCGIEFTDNGQLECVSRNSLRKAKDEKSIMYNLVDMESNKMGKKRKVKP